MCSEPLFIPNFEPFKIHYFHSHFLASRDPDYFLFLIQYVLKLLFIPNFDQSNFDESKSLRFEIRNKKQFQNTLKLGIKSNLDHVMREND